MKKCMERVVIIGGLMLIALLCIRIGVSLADLTNDFWHTIPHSSSAIDSRREGGVCEWKTLPGGVASYKYDGSKWIQHKFYHTEPNYAEILRARDPNGFWLGSVYLSHDFKIVSDGDYLRFKEIKRIADLYDPNRVKSITFYDSNGVGHEVEFHESTVLYVEDFIDEADIRYYCLHCKDELEGPVSDHTCPGLKELIQAHKEKENK